MNINNQHTKCLISGSLNIYPLKGYEKNYLVKCKSCGSFFCYRILTEDELKKHYANYPIGYNVNSEITRKRINEVLNEFEKYRKNNTILDVGCGPGLFLIEAKKRGCRIWNRIFRCAN